MPKDTTRGVFDSVSFIDSVPGYTFGTRFF